MQMDNFCNTLGSVDIQTNIIPPLSFLYACILLEIINFNWLIDLIVKR